jgi:predicted HTH domain antitoxin
MYAATSTQLEIPDSVAEALKLAPADQKQQLLIELASALYARSLLPLGKARELTGLSKYEFGVLLGRRGIPRHYSAEDLRDDLSYGRSWRYLPTSESGNYRTSRSGSAAILYRYDTTVSAYRVEN